MRLTSSVHNLVDGLTRAHRKPAHEDSFPAGDSMVTAVEFIGDLGDPLLLLRTVGEGQIEAVAEGLSGKYQKQNNQDYYESKTVSTAG